MIGKTFKKLFGEDDWPENRRGDAYEGPRPRSNGTPKPAEYPGDPEPPPAVETFTAADLMAMELPETRWAVEGLIPEGLSILAGKPKLGKSWLALNLALAVASPNGVALGNIEVEQGEVLYLALEDTKRRLQGRLRKLLSRMDAAVPPGLTLTTAWPRADAGGWLALLEWLEQHHAARLVIIDTWAKFRPGKQRGRDAYEEDYEHAGQIKALADRRNIALLAMHHCRKLDAEDPVDSVSGTLGLTGGADAVLVLRRERGRHDAALFVTGRDLEERELALQWDVEYALWTVLGQAEEYRMSRERSAILDVIRQAGCPLSPSETATRLDKKATTVKKLMWVMGEKGLLVSVPGGKYGLPP